MVGRLVAVDVATDQARSLDVLVVLIVPRVQRLGEKRVQDAQEAFFAAHQGDEALDVVRHVEGEIVGIALDETLAVGLPGVGGVLPSTVAIAGSREGAAPVEEIAVVQCPGLIGLRQAGVPEGGRGAVDGPVVVGVLQRGGSPGGGVLKRDETLLHITAESLQVRDGGGGHHRVEHAPSVQGGPRQEGVRQDGHGVVAAHAPALVGHQRPQGQEPVGALLLVRQHRQGHVSGPLRMHQQQERMLRPVGVPEGEYRIIVPAVGLMDRPVKAAVGSVHVVID